MPEIQASQPYPILGIGLESWVVRFDKNGVCGSPKTREAMLGALAAKKNSPVLFFSHGWNNDFADAIRLYQAFLAELHKLSNSYGSPVHRLGAAAADDDVAMRTPYLLRSGHWPPGLRRASAERSC